MDDCDEAYGVSLQGANIHEFIILNGGTTSEVDTTLDHSSGTDLTIEVRVSAAGVCTLFVDGAQVTSDTFADFAGHTFDSGEQVYPAIHCVQGAIVTSVKEFECGLQRLR